MPKSERRPTRSIEPALGPWLVAVLVLSVLSLALAYFLTFGDVTPEQRRILELADLFFCFVFLADFICAFCRAPSKAEFMRYGWIDLVSSIPAVPILRFARVGRVLRILRLIRLLRSAHEVRRIVFADRAKSAVVFSGTLCLIGVVVGALLVLEFEHSTGNIQTGPDAIWWAFVTMTTVGYGDFFPATVMGRIVAICLMLFGIGLFGSMTGYLANWFDEPDESEERRREEEILEELSAVRTELAEIKASLSNMTPTPPELPPPGTEIP